MVSDDAPALSLVQRALILKTFPGFAALTANELAVMASICRERYFEAGATMLQPGVPVIAFYLIIEGQAQIIRQGRPAKTHGPRSTVGGLASLTGDPQGAHAVALEDSICLEIDIEDIQDVFEDRFSILLGVLGAMARTLRELQQEIGGGAAITASKELSAFDSDKPLGLVERMFFLRSTTNFSYTSVEALADIADDATELRYESGETIWKAGDEGNYSLMLVNGQVECSPEDGGAPFMFGPGFVVGGLDSIANVPRWYSVVARGPVHGLRLDRATFFDVLEDHPGMAMAMLRSLARGVEGLLDRLVNKAAAESVANKQSNGNGDDEDYDD